MVTFILNSFFALSFKWKINIKQFIKSSLSDLFENFKIYVYLII
jgi:hypothetical protein